MSDWLDDILDGVPTPITYMQLVIIETKITKTNLPQSEKDYIMSVLTAGDGTASQGDIIPISGKIESL